MNRELLHSEADKLFDAFDADGSGEIDYDELHSAIKERAARRKNRAGAFAQPPWDSSVS